MHVLVVVKSLLYLLSSFYVGRKVLSDYLFTDLSLCVGPDGIEVVWEESL